MDTLGGMHTPVPEDPAPTDAEGDDDPGVLDGFERDLDSVADALEALDADDLARAETVASNLGAQDLPDH